MDHRQLAVCSDCLRALLPRRSSTCLQRFRAELQHKVQIRSATSKGPSKALPKKERSFVAPNAQRNDAQGKDANERGSKAHSFSQARRTAASVDRQQKTHDDLNEVYSRVQVLATSVLRPSESPIPTEQRVLYALEQFYSITKELADPGAIANAAVMDTPTRGGSATSALLGSVSRKMPSSVSKATLLNLISSKAEEIIRHPNVHITSAILEMYVELQCHLQRPGSFADIFQLYARKPTPTTRGQGEVDYATPDHKNIKVAVPQETADEALGAAIASHDLDLALSIIDTSVAAPAFTKAKILRKGAIPGGALATFPLLAYGASLQFSNYQTMLDPGQATTMAFACFMTYAVAVGSVGYVAITTSNDQMNRVTWAKGTPLWERWVREEERAALDRVAGVWGFKNLEKRGDEEGEDWETLREACGMRGMILDSVELMEGME